MELRSTPPIPAMAFRFPSQAGAAGSSCTPTAGMGWPLGLRSCMVAQEASPMETTTTTPIAAHTWLQARLEEAPQQNLGFRFPYFSDPSVTSESDSDFQSETVSSSFFKDSRRITLGSLIGLPMDSSGRAGIDLETHYHRPRWSFSFGMAKTCGIRELLGCANCSQSSIEESLSEILMDPEPIGLSQSLAACLELERRNAALEGANQAASSAGRRSPEWSASQFVSCDSLLSDAEDSATDDKGYGSDQAATPFSGSTFSTSRNSNAINGVQRSSSMKSFLSTICCHIHLHQQP